MKTIIYYVFITLLLFSSVSCKSKKDEEASETKAFQLEDTGIEGIQRMQPYKNEQKVLVKGNDYQISIERIPSDSLSKVQNTTGTTFLDNKITLRITRGKGEKVFSRTFTKHSFSSLIGADFLSKSILEGIVFDQVSSNGLQFAASVCYPQTDLYIPLSITVTTDGKMSVKKEELLEETYEGEENI